MRHVTLEAGCGPLLTDYPDEVFELEAGDNDVSSAPAPCTPTHYEYPDELYSNVAQDVAHHRPWNAAEALLQLKLALGDTPRLRPSPADVLPTITTVARKGTTRGGTTASREPGKVPAAPAAAMESSIFLPPLVRYNSSTGAVSPSAYVLASLCHLDEACQRLEAQLEHCSGGLSFVEEGAAADLPWAHLMTSSLTEPDAVSQLLHRAEAVVWERECAYRLHDLLTAELRRRGLPARLASENMTPFINAVQDSHALLTDVVTSQRSYDIVAPLLEAAAARVSCVRDGDALSTPAASASLEQLRASMLELAEQARSDAAVLQRNMESIQRRVDALGTKSTTPSH